MMILSDNRPGIALFAKFTGVGEDLRLCKTLAQSVRCNLLACIQPGRLLVQCSEFRQLRYRVLYVSNQNTVSMRHSFIYHCSVRFCTNLR